MHFSLTYLGLDFEFWLIPKFLEKKKVFYSFTPLLFRELC